MEGEQVNKNLVYLGCQLAGRGYDDGLDMVALGGLVGSEQALNDRDEVGESLAAPCNGLRGRILVSKRIEAK